MPSASFTIFTAANKYCQALNQFILADKTIFKNEKKSSFNLYPFNFTF
jgi:hypothetical protein